VIYYNNWLEVVARIDRLQLNIFLIVLAGYWLYRWYGRQRFLPVAAVAGLVVVVSLVEPLCR
jgi:hypothetical protein